MFLSYKSKSLEKLCTDEKEMQKRRADIAKKLRLRINALEAFSTLAEVVANDPLGKWHPLHGDRAGQWAGKVSSNERLIIQPLANNEIRVESILGSTFAEVQGIEDYHKG
ncbi:MAG: type II toxin-antitoxin system RelE/ParE family toxin [Eggerthellaceae bacterium]|nr:type II toxin-antitoxin system RelE/ParE family toxin [Eggerthellaceae bacterium]